jgi:integrase
LGRRSVKHVCESGLALGPFLTHYLKGRTDLKESTLVALGQTERFLIEFFGKDKPLQDIKPGDADEWRRFLIGKGLADNTVRRRCGAAKQFLRAALRKGLVPSNPFEDLKAAVQGNPKREYFMTRQEAQKVLDACPDAEWRLIFALARYGGLRTPSETLALTWKDINWAEGRFTVHSPKTEHHPGGESRQVPLFPELLPFLREVFEQAESGTEYVITRYRRSNQNLQMQLRRFLKRAGLDPWPKLYQNLRSTRQTELAETFPLHVVCAWIGNSRPVAIKHYLQVTDDHFRKAAQGANQAVQNPVHSDAKPSCEEGQGESDEKDKPLNRSDLQEGASRGTSVHITMVGVAGLEPATSWV